jgi:hypothetical protein
MLMNLLADTHKGIQIFSSKENLNEYGSLEHFRNAASHQITFRKAVFKASKRFLELANSKKDDSASTGAAATAYWPIVTPSLNRHGNSGSSIMESSVPRVPNTSELRRNTVDVSIVAKETGQSPKLRVLKRLRNPENDADRKASKRFKDCPGKMVFRVTEDKGQKRGAGAQTRCILCNKETNWYCMGCRTWICFDNSRPATEGPQYFRDVNGYQARYGAKTQYITCKYTCFLSEHPNFLCTEVGALRNGY